MNIVSHQSCYTFLKIFRFSYGQRLLESTHSPNPYRVFYFLRRICGLATPSKGYTFGIASQSMSYFLSYILKKILQNQVRHIQFRCRIQLPVLGSPCHSCYACLQDSMARF